MPIETNTTINLTATERAAINEIKAEEQTAEEYCETNSTSQEQLAKITGEFLRRRLEGRFAGLGMAIVVAEIEGEEEKLEQAAPHLAALEGIFGTAGA